MHFSDLHRRRDARRVLGACLCAAASLGLEWRPVLAQERGDLPAAAAMSSGKPAFLLTPSLLLQETYTDNVGLLATQRSDFITRGMFDLRADLDYGRTTATLGAAATYDRYARETSLSGFSYSGRLSAQHVILPQRLTLEAEGTLDNQYASTFNGSATDRSGTPGRTQVAIYYLGPKLTGRVGGVADFNAAVRFGQVLYSSADGSAATTPLPSDNNFTQAVARLDTGDHLRTYQSLTTVEAIADNHDYRAASGVQSLYVRVAPGLRVIGRAGYERVRQPGVTNITAGLVTAGVEFRPNADSRISLEGGTRYRRTTWAAEADVKLSPRISMTGRYSESLTPDQIYLANVFEQSVTQDGGLPRPQPPQNTRLQDTRLQDNLYNQTSYNKRAELHLRYEGPNQSVQVDGLWSNRRFLAVNGQDRTTSGRLSLTRHVRPDLNLIAQADYSHTSESPLYGASRSYGVGAGLAYTANTTTEVRADYRYRRAKELVQGGSSIAENVVQIAIQKRF